MPPRSCKADEPAALVVGVDEERDGARQPVKQPPVTAEQSERDLEATELEGRRRHVETQHEAVAVPAVGGSLDDLLGDEQPRCVADLEVEGGRGGRACQCDLDPERLAGENRSRPLPSPATSRTPPIRASPVPPAPSSSAPAAVVSSASARRYRVIASWTGPS